MRILLSISRHLIVTMIAFMVVGLFAIVTVNISFLNPIAHTLEEFSMTDMYYQALQETASEDTSHVITIVDMTELYDRQSIAMTIEQIEAYRPKVLGIDVVFEGPKEEPQGDLMIESIASMYDNTVFSYRLLGYDGNQKQFTSEVHSFFTDNVDVKEGYTNLQRQLYSGIKRELSLSRKSCGEQKSSFVNIVAERYAGEQIVSSGQQDLQINFSPTYFQCLKYDSIKMHPELIRDRIVLFGAMGEETDMHYTPLGKMPGIKLLAYAISTLLNHKEVKRLPIALVVIVSFFLVLLTQLLQDAYEKRVDRIKSPLFQSFLSSSVAVGVITFIWVVLLMWVAFLIFTMSGISLNLGWALSAIAFVDAARSFFDTCLKSLTK